MSKKQITERHLVPCDGADPAPIKDALRLAMSLLKRHTDIQTLTLVIPALDNLDERTSLGEALGKALTKQLKKNRVIRLDPTHELELRTLRDLRRSGPVDAVLAVYFDDAMLDQVDSLAALRFVIVVPWTNKGVLGWSRTWKPRVLGAAESEPERDLISNPVVAVALGKLTQMINLATGISHPSDRDAAEALLWHLWKAGEWVDPEELRPWLVRNGWDPDSADRVVAIAQRTMSRSSPPKSARTYFAKDSIERFREEAKLARPHEKS